MLRTNLAMLLAERNEKISRVAAATGISRTTLTSLAQNTSKMVQFETVDTICRYLRIKPDTFFDYVPFDVSYNVGLDWSHSISDYEEQAGGSFEYETEMFVSFNENGQNHLCSFSGVAQALRDELPEHVNNQPVTDDGEALWGMNLGLEITDKDDLETFNSFYQRMSVGQQSDFRRDTLAEFANGVKEEASKLEFPSVWGVKLTVHFPNGETADAEPYTNDHWTF